MGLLVCFVCDWQQEITPIKKGKQYRCGNCGANRVRIIRCKAHASYIAWVDKEGINAEKARHELYAGLIGYAKRREYKKAEGWAAHKFREITGRWPNGEAVELPAPAASGLLKWIKQQNTAFAKRRRAETGDTLGFSVKRNRREIEAGRGSIDASGKGGEDNGKLFPARTGTETGPGLANMGDRLSMWKPDNVDCASALMADDDWGVKW